MINRALLAALAALIFLAAGAYMYDSLDEKGLALAEASRDACYARHGIDLDRAGALSEAVRIECTRPMRDHDSGQLWRSLFAAAVGATFAFLVVGGLVIVIRRRRQPAAPVGRSGP